MYKEVEEHEDPYLEEHIAQVQSPQFLQSNSMRKRSKFSNYFRNEVARLVLSQIPPQSEILDIGCGDGLLIEMSNAQLAVGVDIDEISIQRLSARNSDNVVGINQPIEYLDAAKLGQTFEYVVMAGLLEQVYDILTVFRKVRELVSQETRVIIVTYSRLWQPLLRLAEKWGLKSTFPIQNWVPVSEISNLGQQSGFEMIKSQRAILIPFNIPGISRWVNRWLAPLPIIRQFAFAHLTVLRPVTQSVEVASVSVVIAARNESGNIASILDRMPKLAPAQEIVFVEGNSSDDTWDEISRSCQDRRSSGYPFTLKAFQQTGVGKGDAIRLGFEESTGDVLIILDADISVPPEELPRFIDCLREGNAEFVNGSRLVYGMDSGAMRFLNLLGNRFFGSLFTFLLGQPIRDTLCGTKALRRDKYLEIAANRAKFGDFDPFGDFDLLFGAAGLNLKIRDQPVHYKARTYGSTNISRFRHGILLLKMSWVAAKKIRFI